MQHEWSLRRDCGFSHTGKRDGSWIKGTATEVYRAVVQSNGRVIIKTRCTDCGRTSGALPTHIFGQWGITWSDVTEIRLNAPRESQDFDPCVYEGCSQTPTEYHHFAPYNTFGDEADKWPVLPLCRNHHHQWHQTMDGYAWHRKRSA